MDILRIKETLNYALSSILKGGKNAPSIYPTFKVYIMIRYDNLAFKELKEKTASKYLIYTDEPGAF